jgi:hypothetical protein
MHLLELPRMTPPQTGLDHPAASGLFTHVNLMPFGQLLARKRRTENAPLRLLQKLQGLGLDLFGQPSRLPLGAKAGGLDGARPRCDKNS